MAKETPNGQVGAVLVIGGGIGGMQAALDLANAGFKAFLLEKQPAIGGVMAQLDKTFPTNDCAMCTLAPRLVEIGRHKDIELITLAELESIEGEPGNFTVRVRKHPRFIDLDKCTGCGDCEEACPVSLPSDFDPGLTERRAIYRPYAQAYPNAFAIDKRLFAPCRNACPAGVNVQGFIALLAQRKFDEALELYRRRNPFPASCGRICGHPCQEACNRSKVDEAVAIRALHRFLADCEIEAMRRGRSPAVPAQNSEGEETPHRGNGRKVAIVGSGPAGLTCAWDLAHMGYRPVVFEALDVPGGMLRVGVPRYRLPIDILDYEIEAIKRTGVEIQLSTPIGPDLTLNDLFGQGFEAIFIAIGTHRSRELAIEGEEMEGVMHGAGFLRRVKTMQPTDVTNKAVVVIGGGNAAIDSARTSLRLGARRVTILYRRSREEMPAREDEIRACEEEGIDFRFLGAPTRILGVGGRVGALECAQMELAEPDASGRRRPIPIEDSKFFLEAEVVIPAISQDADIAVLAGLKAVQVTETGLVPVPGTELKGVRGFTELLGAVSAGKSIDLGARVIVIGGGDVAIDVARTVVRLGAEDVHLACLESPVEMPAAAEAVRAAQEEGLTIHHRLSPKRIVGDNGHATGVEFRECLSVFDEAGRFSPVVRPDSEWVMTADSVVVAVGQAVDWELLQAADGLLETRAGFLRVDPDTLATNVKRIFAGGDVVSGPDVAVHAIVAGHRGAESIDRFLNGEDLKKGREPWETRRPIDELAAVPVGRHERKSHVPCPVLPVSERIRGFSEVETGYTEEQAVQEASRCLHCTGCSECLQCVEACNAEAIDHEMAESTFELNVGAVILAPGFRLFDPDQRLELGSAWLDDVVTSLQFERLLSASGPTRGHVLRPSDGRPPRRVAFIQCVGSRDEEHDYCSSVCCMYATKEAIIAKEHAGDDLDCTIFYMDMRAFGKGFDAYYERAQELGVQYVRCRPSTVELAPEQGRYRIRYERNDGESCVEDFDMVVLSAGLEPPADAEDLAERLGITLEENRFAQTSPLAPVASSRDGVYLCGPFTDPKDIPETVVEASAAAAAAMSVLAPARGTQITQREYPPERDVRGEDPRVGVFVCHCGRNIGGVVDVPSVVEYARTLPNVAYAEENLYTCSSDTVAKIRELIPEHRLNRVVVASCTPRTHEPLFRDTLRDAGLNPYLFEMANIRDQCSWVHMHEPKAATAKARDLVRMAVAKARLLEPLEQRFISVHPDALVVGGGVSGMTAALNLAEQGFRVHLVEKEDKLGGHFRHVALLPNGGSPQNWLSDLIERATSHSNITVHLSSRLAEVEGSVGGFTSTIEQNGGPVQVEHGAAILAVGADVYEPTEYLYGSDARAVTQREFEAKLAADEDVGHRVVMIQCVGSREERRPYCSRICCSQAIKNALAFKERNPSGEATILYRDIRTYGLQEAMYTQARLAGVRFIRYEPENKPELTAEDDVLKVGIDDAVLGCRLTLEADTLVLAPAIVPSENAEEIAQMFKVPRNADGFFLEAHMKLRPIDFATEGVFLCGLAHAPKGVKESIAQAMGAAARAATLLAKDQLELEATISEVVDANCDGCAYCIDPCPYAALTLIEYVRDGQIKKTVESNAALCKGCGVCMATCPKEGIFVRNFRLEQLGVMVEAALEQE